MSCGQARVALVAVFPCPRAARGWARRGGRRRCSGSAFLVQYAGAGRRALVFLRAGEPSAEPLLPRAQAAALPVGSRRGPASSRSPARRRAALDQEEDRLVRARRPPPTGRSRRSAARYAAGAAVGNRGVQVAQGVLVELRLMKPRSPAQPQHRTASTVTTAQQQRSAIATQLAFECPSCGRCTRMHRDRVRRLVIAGAASACRGRTRRCRADRSRSGEHLLHPVGARAGVADDRPAAVLARLAQRRRRPPSPSRRRLRRAPCSRTAGRSTGRSSSSDRRRGSRRLRNSALGLRRQHVLRIVAARRPHVAGGAARQVDQALGLRSAPARFDGTKWPPSAPATTRQSVARGLAHARRDAFISAPTRPCSRSAAPRP